MLLSRLRKRLQECVHLKTGGIGMTEGELEQLIDAYASGLLTDEEERRLASAIDNDPAVGEQIATIGLLRQHHQHDPEAVVIRSFAQWRRACDENSAVVRRVHSARRRSLRSRPKGRGLPFATSASLAVAALLIVMIFFIKPSGNQASSPVAHMTTTTAGGER